MKHRFGSLKMRRHCNLDLSLVTPPSSSSLLDHYDDSEAQQEQQYQQQPQPMTIFYGGKMMVSNVTELQARAILYHASREAEEKLRNLCTPRSVTPSLPSPSLGISNEISMKRSLQRFLHKRKQRVQSTKSNDDN